MPKSNTTPEAESWLAPFGHKAGEGRPRRNLWQAIEHFRSRHDLDDLDPDEIFDGVEDRSPGRDVQSMA